MHTASDSKKPERLNYFDCAVLLEQLQRGGFAEQLAEPIGDKTIHFDALHSYFLTTDADRRAVWAQCLRLLIAARAPLDLNEKTCMALMCFGSWEPTVELTRELVADYTRAGLLDFAAMMAAETAKPLGGAIVFKNAHFVRLMCEMGISWNVGPMVEGGVDRDAFDLASEMSSSEVLSVLTEFLMRKRLAQTGPGAAAAPVASAAPAPKAVDMSFRDVTPEVLKRDDAPARRSRRVSL